MSQRCNCCCTRPAIYKSVTRHSMWESICLECLNREYPVGNIHRANYLPPYGELLVTAGTKVEPLPPGPTPGIPMLIWCPMCGTRHIDEGELATKPHHTHSCQDCGLTWRPAIVPTVGVQFLPGFKNDEKAG